MRARSIAFLGLCGLFSCAVQSQDLTYTFPAPTDYSTQWANVNNLQAMNWVALGESSESESTSSNSTTNLSYLSSTARTRQNLANFVKKSRATDPAGAAQMEEMFASTDVIGQIGQAMGAMGLSHTNLADAYAVYWVSAWKATRGDDSTASAATYTAVAAQAARGLASSPEFARSTDAQKQEMAEALMVQAAMVDGHLEAAADNPAQREAIAEAVLQGARASGLNLNEMTLTATGFQSAVRN